MAPKLMSEKLHAITDTQHRQSTVEYGRIAERSAFIIDAGRAAGEDEASNIQVFLSLQCAQRG